MHRSGPVAAASNPSPVASPFASFPRAGLLAVALAAAVVPTPSSAQPVDPSYLEALSWRNVGPTRGGRVLGVAGDPEDDLVFYQGTAGGGVWKTEDGGLRWNNVSDGWFGTGSVGAVAVAASDADVVYVGMGEACIRGNASHGDGVYRSDDAGRTWRHLGLAATRQIARVRVHPADPDLVYVAALGDAWGPSQARGVYRSRDGGATWDRILHRDENTGAIDLVMDPSDPNVLYASLLELRRFPWGFRSAGPGTGLFKTTDGGDTWTELTDNPGLPEGLKGRIGVTVSPANPSRLWAIVDAALGTKGVFRSDDAGATWTRLNDDADLTQRPWYYHHIVADPADASTVYVLNVYMWKSTDGGVTFERVLSEHLDNHDLWIDPDDPMRMASGTDGGAAVSFNGGETWSSMMNQPTAQMYHAAVDDGTPYRVYGSQQDNTSISLPSRSDLGRITVEDWYTVGGGEDGTIAVNTADPNVVYAADHHFLTRYDHRTRQARDISPNPETHYGWGSADINYRFWWTYPVATSPHDPNTLYVTSQFVHRTRDEGQTWEVISPDLSRADPSTLEVTPSYASPDPGEYWGPITREAYGPEWYATVFAFAESPVQEGVLWAGSDDGLVHVSRDAGATWEDVSVPDLPEFALISIIDPSPFDAATAYVAATRYKLSDHTPYLYRTDDYGRTWTNIARGIPDGDFTRVVRADPGRRGLLYAGTETGVYASFDDGENWQSLRLDLPVVPVHDLVVKDGDLVAATHGRSFWILDGVDYLAQLDREALSAAVHLFQPRTTVRWGGGASPAAIHSAMPSFRRPQPVGDNPPEGVVIPYYLANGATAVVRVLDDDGVVAVFEVDGRAGARRFVWDMRYPDAEVLEDAVFQGSARGPLAPPGRYRVELEADGVTRRSAFDIVRDPRLPYDDDDLRAQFEFQIGVRDELSATMALVGRIRETRGTAQRHTDRVDTEAIENAMKALEDELRPLEERLVQYRARAGQDLIAHPTGIDSKLARLLSFSGMGDGPPTGGQRALLQRLADEVEARRQRFEEILGDEYARVLRLAGIITDGPVR